MISEEFQRTRAERAAAARPEFCAGLPIVVVQALDDLTLPNVARLAMWHLRLRLDLVVFTEVYQESLRREMRVEDSTVHKTLTCLVETGYLEESGQKRPRAFRFPWSRRPRGARGVTPAAGR